MVKENLAPIIDANINRVSEGLRVIEEYVRFVASKKELTQAFSSLRKLINQSESEREKWLHLAARNTSKDMRAEEVPTRRVDLYDALKANFKRVEEGLRVLEEYTGESVYNQARYSVYDLEKEVLLTMCKPILKKGIYLISDDPEIIEKGLKWGVAIVQLRAKNLPKSEILNRAHAVREMTKRHAIPLMINDHLDIAQLVDADGLHTGQDDLSVSELRKLLGPHKLLGRTTHTLDQGLLAEKQGADYVSVGPIWETPSKPGREGIGFEYLKSASNSLSIPFVAIGGVSMENMSELLPYHPPLIGLIRDYESIPLMQKKMDAF